MTFPEKKWSKLEKKVVHGGGSWVAAEDSKINSLRGKKEYLGQKKKEKVRE